MKIGVWFQSLVLHLPLQKCRFVLVGFWVLSSAPIFVSHAEVLFLSSYISSHQILKEFMVHQLAVMFDKLRASGHGLNQRELIEDVRYFYYFYAAIAVESMLELRVLT